MPTLGYIVKIGLIAAVVIGVLLLVSKFVVARKVPVADKAGAAVLSVFKAA